MALCNIIRKYIRKKYVTQPVGQQIESSQNRVTLFSIYLRGSSYYSGPNECDDGCRHINVETVFDEVCYDDVSKAIESFDHYYYKEIMTHHDKETRLGIRKLLVLLLAQTIAADCDKRESYLEVEKFAKLLASLVNHK